MLPLKSEHLSNARGLLSLTMDSSSGLGSAYPIATPRELLASLGISHGRLGFRRVSTMRLGFLTWNGFYACTSFKTGSYDFVNGQEAQSCRGGMIGCNIYSKGFLQIPLASSTIASLIRFMRLRLHQP